MGGIACEVRAHRQDPHVRTELLELADERSIARHRGSHLASHPEEPVHALEEEPVAAVERRPRVDCHDGGRRERHPDRREGIAEAHGDGTDGRNVRFEIMPSI